MRVRIFFAAMLLPVVVLAQSGWELQMKGLPANDLFHTVSVTDSGVAWIAGAARMWKSSDAGNSWVPIAPFTVEEGVPWVIVALSPRNVVCATERGKIMRTTDGGLSWVKVFDDTTVTTFFNDFKMFDQLNGYAMGDPPNSFEPPGFVKTTDGGQTWRVVKTNLPPGDFQYTTRTDFIRPEVGWTKVYNDGIYRTTDGGATWNRIYSSHAPSNVFFLNDSVGFYTALGYGPDAGLSKTTDGGITWKQKFSGEAFIFVRWAPGAKHLWAGRDTLFLSTDSGETWQRQFSSKSVGGSTLEAASFLSEDNGMIVGDNIVLGKTHGPSFSGPVVRDVPTSVELDQNYPNPFNPSTTIRYSLPNRSHVSLAVYNTLGQQVATLVNGEMEAGCHEVRFDGSGLASGVYFYRLQAGSFVQTRKLLLLR